MTKAAGQAASPLSLLFQRPFGPFFFGRLASHLAAWIHNIAAVVLVYDLTGSALAVGLVSVAQFVPQATLSAWGGALSDRYDRRKLLVLGRVPAGVVCLVLAGITAWSDSDVTVLWAVYAVGSISGTGWSIGTPAGHALVPALVTRESLTNAIALTAITGNVSRTIGPAVAGAILFFGDAWMAFFLAGLGHISFGVVVLLLPVIGQTRAPGGVRSSIREGLSYVFRRQRLWVPLLAGAIVGLGMEPILTLGPSLAVEFGIGGDGAAVVATAFGLGAVMAVGLLSAVRGRWGLELCVIGGFALLAVALALLSVAPTLGVALVSLFFGGIGTMFATASLQAWLQHSLDDNYRGRVMSLWALTFIGSRPVSALMLGAAGDLWGARAGVALSMLGAVAGALLLLQRWLHWGKPMTERRPAVAPGEG